MGFSSAIPTASSSAALPSGTSRRLRRSTAARGLLLRPATSPAKTRALFTPVPGEARGRATAAATPFVRDQARFGSSEVCSRKMAGEAAAAAGESFGAGEGKPEVLVFGSEEELSVSLAKYTAELSEKYTQERGAFSVVLSGGSLIKSLR